MQGGPSQTGSTSTKIFLPVEEMLSYKAKWIAQLEVS
jgi:hypothetical protein